MPEQKIKNSRKTAADKPIKRRLMPLRLVFICLSLIMIVFGVSRIFKVSDESQKVTGTANLSEKQLESLSEIDKYESLDLRVAALAVYKGTAIETKADKGVFNGVRHSEISFPVYAANLREYGYMTLPTSPPASRRLPGNSTLPRLC